MQSRPRFGFEGFQVWQDARDLAVLCHGLSAVLRRGGKGREARLLLRAGHRPAVHLAEASEATTLRSFMIHLQHARDSSSILSALISTIRAPESVGEDLGMVKEIVDRLIQDLLDAIRRKAF